MIISIIFINKILNFSKNNKRFLIEEVEETVTSKCATIFRGKNFHSQT